MHGGWESNSSTASTWYEVSCYLVVAVLLLSGTNGLYLLKATLAFYLVEQSPVFL